MTKIQRNIASPSTGKNTDFCRLVTLLKPCFNHHFFFYFAFHHYKNESVYFISLSYACTFFSTFKYSPAILFLSEYVCTCAYLCVAAYVCKGVKPVTLLCSAEQTSISTPACTIIKKKG